MGDIDLSLGFASRYLTDQGIPLYSTEAFPLLFIFKQTDVI